jgi:hypothetical protein
MEWLGSAQAAAWASAEGLSLLTIAGVVDEGVVLDGIDHEECDVHAACDVALEHGVADVAAGPGCRPFAV